LYFELQSLKEIVSDFLSYQFNSSVSILKTADENCHQNGTLQLHHIPSALSNDGHQRDANLNPSECSSHLLEIIDQVKVFLSLRPSSSLVPHFWQDSLTLSKLHLVEDTIRQALINERDDFEGEIQVLQATMDTESEIISRGNTPNKTTRNTNPVPLSPFDLQIECPHCGNKLNPADSLSPRQANGNGHDSFLLTASTSPRATTATRERGKSKLMKSLPQKAAMTTATAMTRKTTNLIPGICSYCNSQPQPQLHQHQHQQRQALVSPPASSPSSSSSLYQEPMSRPGTAGGGISRVRSKIQAARDEKHFLDEEIFRI
jgi:hypothetical protein